jgi:hypothetical protein
MVQRILSGTVIAIALLGVGANVSVFPVQAAGNHPASYPCALQPNQPQCKHNAPSVTSQGSVVAAGTGVTTSGAVSSLPKTGGATPASNPSVPAGVLGLLILGLGLGVRRLAWNRR